MKRNQEPSVEEKKPVTIPNPGTVVSELFTQSRDKTKNPRPAHIGPNKRHVSRLALEGIDFGAYTYWICREHSLVRGEYGLQIYTQEDAAVKSLINGIIMTLSVHSHGFSIQVNYDVAHPSDPVFSAVYEILKNFRRLCGVHEIKKVRMKVPIKPSKPKPLDFLPSGGMGIHP